MTSSHAGLDVVQQARDIVERAQGLVLTPDLAAALGAALAARWPVLTSDEARHFFLGMHAGRVLDAPMVSERCHNIAAAVISLGAA